MSKENTEYTPQECIDIIKNVINANDKIMERGETPISLSLIGTPGMGKTTICREVAKELGRGFFKLNLAQLTEPAELIGYYAKEFLVVKGEEEKWISEEILSEFISQGYEYTERVRTRPCPPEWVENIEENSILLLDDYNRSNNLFSQSVMELINEGTMIGWDLKDKKVQILLTENPDDGEFNVSSLDSAQTDRKVKLHMKWDYKDWAVRAEKIGVDERLINFVLWKPELFEQKKKDGISASGNITPRMMDKFFTLISTIDDFHNNVENITTYGSISVGDSMTSELINFINKRLDKLPSVKKLISEMTFEQAETALKNATGSSTFDGNNFNVATSAILATRMYNYMITNHNSVSKDEIRRYLELLLLDSFAVDQKYNMAKQVISLNPKFPKVIAGDSRFIKFMVE